MFIKFGCLIILASFSFAVRAYALTPTEEQDLVLVKARIEELVVKKYRDRISTRISKDLFSVGAQVTLDVVAQKNPAAVAPGVAPELPKALKTLVPSDLPDDISLGMISRMEEITASEVATPTAPTGLPVAAPPRPPTSFKLRSIEVYVGISPKIAASYREPFSDWLNTNIKSEFGTIGKATVTDLILATPEEKEKPAPPVERVLSFEERFGNFQNLAGLSVIALIAMLGLFLGKLLPSRDARERTATAVRIHEMTLAQQAQLESNRKRNATALENKSSSGTSALSANLLYESHREAQKKVAFIVLSSRAELDRAMELWLGEGEVGRRKIATVLDCVLTHIGTSGFESANQDWLLPEKLRHDKDLLVVFQTFPTIEMDARTQLLDQAYWELLSIKTLGDSVVKKRFQSIAQLPAQQIEEMLNVQDPKVRSVALLHLPGEKLEKVLSHMSFEEKRRLLDGVMDVPHVKESELEIVDQTLALMIDREKNKREKDGVVEISSLLPNLLASMAAAEEIRLVSELSTKDGGTREYLLLNYPSLAFVAAWPTEALRSLMTGATAAQVSGLMQVLPEARSLIMTTLPTRMRAMIQDEVKSKRTPPVDAELDELLSPLRERAFDMFENGSLDLSKLSSAPKKAAA